MQWCYRSSAGALNLFWEDYVDLPPKSKEISAGVAQVTIPTSELAGFTEVSVIFVPDFVKLPGA